MTKSIVSLAAMLLLPLMGAVAQTHTITRPTRTEQQPAKPATTTQQAKPATKKKQAQPKPHVYTAEERNDILARLAADMVRVEGGTFTMGATEEQKEAYFDSNRAKPTHKVTLSSFSICKHEVTQEEWEVVMGSNPSEFKGRRMPVEHVSWNDCQIFIEKLNQLTGKKYRMLTEAEWEYAARGGNMSKGYKFSGSNTLDNVAWHDDNCGDKTHEVMTKSPNELGLYDMTGNVEEWCQDWDDDYSASEQKDPKGPSTGTARIIRGGAWYDSSHGCLVARRASDEPSFAFFGLRLAL